MARTPLPTNRPTQRNSPALSLFRQLEGRGIHYCLWKSSDRLAEGIAGETDFDVLIHSAALPRVTKMLRQAGWISLIAEPWRTFSGLRDFVCWDPARRCWLHLHLYTQLRMGESLVKSLSLPLGACFLDQSMLRQGVRVAAPALEFIVFIIRAAVKQSFGGPVRVLWQHLCGTDTRAAEFSAIRKRTSAAALAATLAWPELSFLSARSKGYIQEAYTRAAPALSRAAIHTLCRDVACYRSGTVLQRFSLFLRRVFQRSWYGVGKTFTRGPSIAICGPDGAGKTTLSDALGDTLATHFAVRRYYMGGTLRSAGILRTCYQLLFFAPYAFLRKCCTRLSLREGVSLLDHWYYPLHNLLVAREKLHRWQHAQEYWRKGHCVLFERFPIFPGYGDGLAAQPFKAFQTYEARTYQSIGVPDLVVMLDISPRLAIQRKPTHDAVVLRQKAEAFRQALPHLRGNVLRLNAAEPTADLVSRILQQLPRLGGHR